MKRKWETLALAVAVIIVSQGIHPLASVPAQLMLIYFVLGEAMWKPTPPKRVKHYRFRRWKRMRKYEHGFRDGIEATIRLTHEVFVRCHKTLKLEYDAKNRTYVVTGKRRGDYRVTVEAYIENENCLVRVLPGEKLK